MLLATGLALLLGQLAHLLLHVPHLPLHALVLLLFPVLRRHTLVPLLSHLLQVLLEAADQGLRVGGKSEIITPGGKLLSYSFIARKNNALQYFFFSKWTAPTLRFSSVITVPQSALQKTLSQSFTH